jgi:hypothetical protein
MEARRIRGPIISRLGRQPDPGQIDRKIAMAHGWSPPLIFHELYRPSFVPVLMKDVYTTREAQSPNTAKKILVFLV